MKVLFKDVNGLFRITEHSGSARGIWAVAALLSSVILFLGLWALITDHLHLQQELKAPFLSPLLASSVILLLPAVTLAITLARCLQEPGMYLHGVRFTGYSIERGTLRLPASYTASVKSDEETFPAMQIDGEWLTDTIEHPRDAEIIIVVRQQNPILGLVRLDRFAITLDGHLSDRLDSEAGNENCWQKLAIVSKGTILPVKSPDSLDCSDLLRMLEAVARVLSSSAQTPSPRCTLQLLSCRPGQNNPLATGVLGSFTANERGSSPELNLEEFFGPSYCEPLKKHLHERRWRCYLDGERQ